MNKLMLVNEAEDEVRVAIVQNGKLQELQVEQKGREQSKGNIYRGAVVQIEKSLQAAFIDYGAKKHGFLPLDGLNFQIYKPFKQGTTKRIEDLLKVGQPVIVQVLRDEISKKGAFLTTFISLAGRYLALSPNSAKTSGISRRISDAKERRELEVFLQGVQDDIDGVIVRTVAAGCGVNELSGDLRQLKEQWLDIDKRFKSLKKPGLLYKERDIVIRMIRDYYTPNIGKIFIDTSDTFQKVYEFFADILPTKIRTVKLYNHQRPIFYEFGIEPQIESLAHQSVELASGGRLVIEQTEALVVIDVNSAKSTKEKNSRQSILKTNLEAAKEAAIQLRLRNLGGLVVIDFIDMDDSADRKLIFEAMEKAMADDKASHTIGPISQFGIMELSRQRISQGYAKTMEDVCPNCMGTGQIPNIIATANRIIRDIHELAIQYSGQQIKCVIPTEVAGYLLNQKRSKLVALEREFSVTVVIVGKVDEKHYHPENIMVFENGTAAEYNNKRSQFVKASPTEASTKTSLIAASSGQQATDALKLASKPPRQKSPKSKSSPSKAAVIESVAAAIKPATAELLDKFCLFKTTSSDYLSLLDTSNTDGSADNSQGITKRDLSWRVPRNFCFKKPRRLGLPAVNNSNSASKEHSAMYIPPGAQPAKQPFILELSG